MHVAILGLAQDCVTVNVVVIAVASFAILSVQGPTEHVVPFNQADCAWRIQYWSDDVSSERFDAEEERIKVFVENPDNEPLEYQAQPEAEPTVVAPRTKALVFDDTVWELMMVNRSAETEQAILSSLTRSGTIKLRFEPVLEGEKEYRVKVSLRRAMQRR